MGHIDEDDDNDDEITLSDNESLVSIEERTCTSERSIHAKMIKLTQDLIPSSMRSQEYANNNDAQHDDAYHPPPLDSPTSSHNRMGGDDHSMSGSDKHGMETIIDPRDGLELLPVYLRGGVHAVGFGDLLGNALALLYVARQGE